MEGRGESIYDPTSGLRGDVNGEKLDAGIGQNPEKSPTATLRIFGSNLGNQWLMYGGILGGTQDYLPSSHGGNTPAKCSWFRFVYRGIMEIGAELIYGLWTVTVEGSGLEIVAYQVGRHIKPTLKVGDKETGLHSVSVKAIRIEPVKLRKQKGMGADEVEMEEE